MPRRGYRLGDRVVHVSGGPVMGVTASESAIGLVRCEFWSERSQAFVAHLFRHEMLELAPQLEEELELDDLEPV